MSFTSIPGLREETRFLARRAFPRGSSLSQLPQGNGRILPSMGRGLPTAGQGTSLGSWEDFGHSQLTQ